VNGDPTAALDKKYSVPFGNVSVGSTSVTVQFTGDKVDSAPRTVTVHANTETRVECVPR
jgi:hypothetical protein